MRAITYSRLRQTLATVMDEVADRHEPVIVTRAGGPSAVLMSLEDFASFEETRYLNASPANAKRLDEAMAQADRGEGLIFVDFDALEDVFKRVKPAAPVAE
jgi:antitoxin YefM